MIPTTSHYIRANLTTHSADLLNTRHSISKWSVFRDILQVHAAVHVLVKYRYAGFQFIKYKCHEISD